MSVPASDRPSGRTQWFTTTHWSVVLAAKGGDSEHVVRALEKLCQTYWRPLYNYIRREGYDVQDAQDLTQGFFSRLIEKDYLGHLHHRAGKFRSFLLTFLKHFLSDERDKAATQKRGGGKSFFSLNDTRIEEQHLELVGGLSPDQIFERRWAQTVLAEAVNRLQREYMGSGKTALFEQLKDFQPGKHGALSYADVAARLGMTESAIKSAVHRLRLRHSEILREEIAHTVARPEEIDEEIRYLLTILSD